MNLNLTTRYNKRIKSLLQPVEVGRHSLVTAAVSTSGDDALQ